MNEFLLGVVSVLLFFKILDFLKESRFKGVVFLFDKSELNQSDDVLSIDPKKIKTISGKTKRNYLTKKKVGKLK